MIMDTNNEYIPRLAERPEARPWKVEELVNLVRGGRMWIPGFQRQLRWTEKDAVALLDSIDRGFPIGTLLLWKGKAPSPLVEFGPMTVSREDRYEGYAVVDGQQRLTWLIQMLHAGKSSAGRRFVFDLEKHQFLVLPRNEPPSLAHVPAECLVDSAKLMGWVFDNVEALTETDRATVFELGKRVRDYPVPSYIIETTDEATVREVFKRQNSTGKQLQESDVFNAINQRGLGQVGPLLAGAFAPTTLRELSQQLEAEQFGHIDESVLVKIVKAMQGQDVGEQLRATQATVPSGAPSETLQRAERCVRAAILFLREDANIPHEALLPYTLPLVTLAVFFDAHPAPSARSRELLARWIWRGAASGSHQGGTVATRAALSSARQEMESAAVQSLLRLVEPQGAHSPVVLDRFRMSFAASKIIANVMLDARPLRLDVAEIVEVSAADLFAGLALPEPSRHATLLPHLVQLRRDEKRVAIHACAANYLLHPHVLLAHPRRYMQDAPEQALRSHFLSHEILELLAIAPEQALAQRAKLMQDATESFVARHAAWTASDRPAIADLVIDNEDAA
jgi:hypothetical protein